MYYTPPLLVASKVGWTWLSSWIMMTMWLSSWCRWALIMEPKWTPPPVELTGISSQKSMKCSLTPHWRALNVTCLAHWLEGHHILKCDCALFHLGGSSLAMTWGDTGVWMGDRGTVIQGGGNPVSPVQSCKRVYCIIGLGIHVYTYEKSHIHILATKYDKSYRGWRQPSVTCPTCLMCVI